MIKSQRLSQQELNNLTPNNHIVYPTIDAYSCPRVSRQKIQNSSTPLSKYLEPIVANNCATNYQGNYVDPIHCRKFKEKDGLIYTLKEMKKQCVSVKNPIRALICICMYNQSKDAINQTLKGVYRNLKHFKEQNVSAGEIAVVLIQDGILKLVANRQKRTFVHGEESMIHFYRKLDKYDGKSRCELEARINIILDQMQNFQRKSMKGNVARNRDFPPSIEKNIALIYQNLWKPSITHFEKKNKTTKQIQKEKYKDQDQDFELRVFSCFKHTNGTKLSSHLWFFEGFCRYYKPQFCVLLDVGTAPSEKGVLNLLKGFSGKKDIGGVTGFMSVDAAFGYEVGQDDEQEEGCISSNFASIEKAQQYQYIMAHFIDKNAESALGFLHVLPGAWSAYRYEALIKSQKYEPNLLERSYFKMILDPDKQEKDYKQANMYLAEDRILSLGIYCQMDSQYLLKYVPDATAFTDPMKSHQTLMNQRRRWINSSLFAFWYVFQNYYFNVMDSRHNCFRKYITLNLSMFLALLSFLFSYISPSLFFFVLYATIAQMGFSITNADGVTVTDVSSIIAQVVTFIYTLIFLSAVGGALTGRQWAKSAQVISAAFAFFNLLMILLVIYNIIVIYLVLVEDPIPGTTSATETVTAANFFDQPKRVIIVATAIITMGSFILILLVHLPSHPKFVWKIIKDSSSYFYYTGAYSQTMVIHSFCNVDDVSWGTKGSTSSHGGKKYQIQKVYFVSAWFFWNALLAYIFIYIDVIVKNQQTNVQRGGWVLIALAIIGAATISLKTSFAIYYHMKWLLFEKCCSKIDGSQQDYRKIEEFWEKQFLNWKKQYQKDAVAQMHSRIQKRK